MKTQTERVLALSKRFNGVCQADLLLPDVADGGAPITRVAARLWDLEQEGYEFEAIGTRSKTKVFRLIEDSTGRDLQVRGAGSISSRTTATNEQQGRRAAEDYATGPPVIQTDPDSSKDLEPEPLFKAGKPQFGWADQGELDAA